MINIPTEYKGLKVIHKKRHKLNGINASFDNKTKTITVYDRWTKRSKERRAWILFHEYAHYIYMNKIPYLYKKVWELISNWKLIKILRIFWITEYTENVYLNKQSERNANESFAWLNEQYVLGKAYPNYIWTKIKLARAMFLYFDK